MQSDPNARYALGELTCWRRFGIDPGADFRSDPSVPRIGLSIFVVSRSDAGQSKIGTSIANGSMVDRRQQLSAYAMATVAFAATSSRVATSGSGRLLPVINSGIGDQGERNPQFAPPHCRF